MEKAAIRELSPDEVREVYRQRMPRDFPLNERKPLRKIESMIRQGRYRCFGMMEGRHMAAYAFFIVLEDRNYLLDYIAVDQTRRGTGIGSRFLQMLCETPLRGAACVLLEVEDPAAAHRENEIGKRQRRLRFYQKNGMIDTNVKTNAFFMDYLLLRMPLGDPEADVRGLYRAFYRASFSRLVCWLLVHVR